MSIWACWASGRRMRSEGGVGDGTGRGGKAQGGMTGARGCGAYQNVGGSDGVVRVREGQ